jgi:hypothetical protein
MTEAKEHWKSQPDAHDFPAAADYLELVLAPKDVERAVAALKSAKDLSRASGLPLLPPDNIHVAKDLDKVKQGVTLSPVLLVRGQAGRGVPLTVADGYHRISASYHIDENADIPCRIADL